MNFKSVSTRVHSTTIELIYNTFTTYCYQQPSQLQWVMAAAS